MGRLCVSCGAIPAPAARFCRQCGTPLIISSRDGADSVVSPQAPTMPLEQETGTTDGLGFWGDTRESGEGTNRLNRDEIDRILRSGTGERRSGEPPIDAGEISASVTRALDSGQLGPTVSKVQDSSDSARVDVRRKWLVAAICLLCVFCVAAVMAIFVSRGMTRNTGIGGTPITLNDLNNAFEDQIAQVEGLYKSGDTKGALARLKVAARLAPSHSVDQQRLGMLFLKLGATNEALNYLNQAIKLDVDNVDAWRGLAEAQFRAGKYTESAASYRKVLSAVGDDPNFDSLRLEYTKALRMSDNSDEVSSEPERPTRPKTRKVSSPAKRHLQEVASGASRNRAPVIDRGPAINRAPAVYEMARGENVGLRASAAKPMLKGEQADPRSVRAIAAHSPDALFVEGMRIVGGRKPKILQRAELVRALELFQYASRNGKHRSEAARYAEQLGKEYDRRKNWR